MKAILFILIQFLILGAQAQWRISGNVETPSCEPIAGANVYIQGTYDGGTTDSLGYFGFTTSSSGIQKLMVSYIGFETQSISLDMDAGNTTFNQDSSQRIG
jgi:hypothetical protein